MPALALVCIVRAMMDMFRHPSQAFLYVPVFPGPSYWAIFNDEVAHNGHGLKQ